MPIPSDKLPETETQEELHPQVPPHVTLTACDEYLPAGQKEQAVAPVALENLPAEQTMHSALPDTSEYAPAPHEMHSVLADALGACIVTVADRYDPSLQG